jgi:ABC-type spermidine/putrescine transport system permease subunit I
VAGGLTGALRGARWTSPSGRRPRQAGFDGRAALLVLPLVCGATFLILPLCALTARALSEDGVSAVAHTLENELFLSAVWRTLLLSITVTLICSIVGTGYAIAVTAVGRVFGAALLAALFTTFWISVLVRTFGWVLLFEPNGALDQFLRKLGLLDQPLDIFQTTGAMYPAMVHVMLPYQILPVYAAMRRLDPSQLKAAQSLGAPPRTVLRHVVMPHVRPAILAGAALVFMFSLAFYITPALLGGPGDFTVATIIAQTFNQELDFAQAATMSLLLLVFILVLYLLVDRFVPLIPAGEERS